MSPLHILHLSPHPSLSLLLYFFIYQSLLISSMHFVDGSATDYLHLVSRLPGFLLVVRPAGSFFGGSPYGPGEEKIRAEYEQNGSDTQTASASTTAKALGMGTNE